MWAKPGARCRCISRHPDTDNPIYGDIVFPIVGNEYTVREVTYDNGGVGLRLVEIENPVFMWRTGPAEPDFGVWRFTPIVGLHDDMEMLAHHLLGEREPA